MCFFLCFCCLSVYRSIRSSIPESIYRSIKVHNPWVWNPFLIYGRSGMRHIWGSSWQFQGHSCRVGALRHHVKRGWDGVEQRDAEPPKTPGGIMIFVYIYIYVPSKWHMFSRHFRIFEVYIAWYSSCWDEPRITANMLCFRGFGAKDWLICWDPAPCSIPCSLATTTVLGLPLWGTDCKSYRQLVDFKRCANHCHKTMDQLTHSFVLTLSSVEFVMQI